MILFENSRIQYPEYIFENLGCPMNIPTNFTDLRNEDCRQMRIRQKNVAMYIYGIPYIIETYKRFAHLFLSSLGLT